MPRILMFNNEFPPLGGGTATVNETLFRHFAKYDDCQIDLITASADNTSYSECFSSNITIHYLALGTFNIHHAPNKVLIKYFFKALFLARQLTADKHYDLLFAWCTVPAGALTLIFNLLRGIPYIVRVSGPDLPGFEQRYAKTVRLLLPLLRITWKHSRHIIAKCYFERQILSAYTSKEKIILIPNGVDFNTFAVHTQEIAPCSEVIKILSVGRLIERKQHHVLIKAAAHLKDKIPFHISIIGDGDDAESLKRLIIQHQLEQHIALRGSVERKMMPEIYSNHHLFIHLSQSEGMSIALLEAYAAGLPILCTPSGGTEYFSNDDSCQFVKSTEPEIVSDAIIAASKNLAGKKPQEIRASRYLESLSWESIAESYYRIIIENVKAKGEN